MGCCPGANGNTAELGVQDGPQQLSRGEAEQIVICFVRRGNYSGIKEMFAGELLNIGNLNEASWAAHVTAVHDLFIGQGTLPWELVTRYRSSRFRA